MHASNVLLGHSSVPTAPMAIPSPRMSPCRPPDQRIGRLLCFATNLAWIGPARVDGAGAPPSPHPVDLASGGMLSPALRQACQGLPHSRSVLGPIFALSPHLHPSL